MKKLIAQLLLDFGMVGEEGKRMWGGGEVRSVREVRRRSSIPTLGDARRRL